jgi:hypothetical protein
VKKGLEPQVQQALDIVRVIGNNAVHPGEITVNDNRDTATTLFGLVNLIVESQIARPKQIGALFDALPSGALNAIETPRRATVSMSKSKRIVRGFHILAFSLAGVCAPWIALMLTAGQANAACDQGAPVSGRFYIKGDQIAFRTGPGTSFTSVINKRASEVLKRTEHRTLWSSMVLDGFCETDEWLQGRIAEADGHPVDWETGWVHKQFVTQNVSAEVQAGLIWDVDDESDFTGEEKTLVKQGALKVLKDERNCKSIFTGYRSDSRKGAYYVTCNARDGGEAFNVWFTPSELQSGDNLARPKPYPEGRSRKLCEEAIEARVSHPSTLDVHQVVGYATKVHNNSNRTVVQEFTAKNSFGLELKHRAVCLIQPNGSYEITISEVQ